MHFSCLITYLLFVVQWSILTVHCHMYNWYDPVTILDSSNFSRFVIDRHTNGQKLQLVQFYLNFCADSAMLATQFKNFSAMVREHWNDLVDISVVDCGIHQEPCVEYGEYHYPKIKALWFDPKEYEHEDDFPVTDTGNETLSTLRDNMITWISNKLDKNQSITLPANFPHFHPLVANSANSLVKQLNVSSDDATAVIVVEKNISIVGRQIMMDLSKFINQVPIYRMNEQNIAALHEALPETRNLELPFLVAYNKSHGFHVFTKSKDHEYSHFMKVIDQNILASLKSDQIHPIDTVTSYSSAVFWPDLHNAVWYMLFHDVPRRSALNRTQLHVLQRLIHVVQYLEFPRTQTRNFLHALEKQVLVWALEAGPLPIKEYEVYVKKLAEKYHFGDVQEYIACSNVEGRDDIPERHIPCSHWTMYHALTVADYKRAPNPPKWSIKQSALYLVRQYMRHYFTCIHCADHFWNMSRNIEHEVHSPLEAVTWLWHGHNRVNARLKNTNSDVIELPKRQFPTYAECATCYLDVPDETEFNNVNVYSRHFNHTAITQFLLSYYDQSEILKNRFEVKFSKARLPFISEVPNKIFS